MTTNSRTTDTNRVELLDLLVVGGYAVLAGTVILIGVVSGPLRVLLAAPLLGVCPGYAVISALLPATTAHPETGEPHPRWRHRAALGIATSLMVLVVAGVALSPVGFGTAVIVGATLSITVVGCLVAAVRRRRVPSAERLRVPLGTVAADVRDATTRSSRLDTALNVALALVVVVGMATLAVGLAVPGDGETYSEVALAGDDAGNESYAAGEQATLALEAENQDGEAQSYTAVVVLERFADDASDGDTPSDPSAVERAELSRTELTVPDSETRTQSIEFTPDLLGEDLRLSVYVYVGAAPDTAGSGSADYHLYRWVDVDDGASSLASPPDGTSAPSGA